MKNDTTEKITGATLIDLGLKPGAGFKEAIEEGNTLLSNGKSWEETKKELHKKYFKEEVVKIKLRDKNKNLISIACNPTTQEEKDNVTASISKMEELSQIPIIEKLTLMPDNCPSGQEWGSIPVGGGAITKNCIIPSLTSSDMHCSMSATFFKSPKQIGELMRAIEKSTNFGPYPAPTGQESSHSVLKENVWGNQFLTGFEDIALKYLGTQGDGNHFSYIGELEITSSLIKNLEEDGHYLLSKSLHSLQGETLKTLVTHHGSRNLGARLYKRGLDAAIKETNKIAENIPKTGAWLDLDTKLGKEYWEALLYVGRWTKANHEIIHEKFLNNLGVNSIANIGNAHNSAWVHNEKIYHGKGATPAWKIDGKPQLGIIPLNMGREILLVSGLDNPDYLSFAPHGAGRNRSRSATIKPFLNEKGTVDKKKVAEAIERETKGLHIAWGSGKADISESPLGYKNPDTIKKELVEFGLAKLIGEIKPKGCIMAGEIEALWKQKKREKKEKNNKIESINNVRQFL